jgi:hypothetical protein
MSTTMIKFRDLPVGARFEFRGRRYEKLALSMARDEDRLGNVFHADAEVRLTDDSTQDRPSRIVVSPHVTR